MIPPTNLANSGPSIAIFESTSSPSYRIPHSFAIAIAVTKLSPVTILTLIPAVLHIFTASGTSLLIISFIPAIQIKVKPPSSTSYIFEPYGLFS
jgi:hypothetical protein